MMHSTIHWNIMFILLWEVAFLILSWYVLDTFFSDHSEDGIYFRSHTYAKFDEESEFGGQNTKIW
jgi:hypothetical protein